MAVKLPYYLHAELLQADAKSGGLFLWHVTVAMIFLVAIRKVILLNDCDQLPIETEKCCIKIAFCQFLCTSHLLSQRAV